MKLIARVPQSLNRLSMSSSVISANGDSPPGSCTFCSSASKISVQLLARLPHPQAHQPQARLRVEDDHQDDPVADELDVDVGLLALVELRGELVLA